MKVPKKTKKQIAALLVVCLCMLASPVANYASVPQLMSYQGLLKDAQGNYLTGTYNMIFRIYSVATGGSALWSETQSGVSATSGRFNVELGSVSALNLSFNAQYWLSIQVGSDAEMSPRVKLTSAGYAYNSENVVNSFTETAHDSKSHMDVEGVKAAETNIAKTNFKLDAYSAASANNLGDMIVDVFHDESGINTTNSTHYLWQGSPHYNVTTQSVNSPTALLLHANGADATTTFAESSNSNHSVTSYGNAQIDTAQSKFGGAAALFDGNGDYLTVSDSAGWDFGSGDFTVDFWVYHNNAIGSLDDYINYYGGTNKYGWFIRRLNTGSLQIVLSSDGSNWDFNQITTETISSNAWHHIAVVRTGNTIKPFIDGTLATISTTTYSNAISTAADVLSIGREAETTAYMLNGSLDEIRISKGIARWTANFTPPASEYAASETPDPATVISVAFSETTAPSEAMIIGDGVLNGGTITYSVSRDNGTTWSQASNESVVSLSSQPSGTQIRWKAVLTGEAELNAIAVALAS
ncbi:MAG: LamG domain-containing protein [Candidatus Omnitrophota bacterium]